MVANSLKMFHQRSSEHTKILSPRILSRQTKHTAAYILQYIDVDVAFQWKCSIFNRPNEITFYTVVCFSCFHFTYNAASTVLIIMYRDAVMFIWAVADMHQLSTVYGLSHRQIQSDIGISLAKFIFARHLRFYKHSTTAWLLYFELDRLACRQVTTHIICCSRRQVKSQCAQRPASNYISRIQVLSSNWSTSINKVCAWIFVWVVYTLRIASTLNTLTSEDSTNVLWCDVMCIHKYSVFKCYKSEWYSTQNTYQMR